MVKQKRASSKREKLIDAAVALAYRQGFGKTTLADIAGESGVPLGNVYYYFKTRDDIGHAVVDRRLEQWQELRARLEAMADPRERLAAYVDVTARNAANVAQYGCPMGSLSAELLKEGGDLGERSTALFSQPMAYLAEQFSALGHAEHAEELALRLQSALQGASLMTQSFHEPTLLEREGERLKLWIDGL